MTPLQRSRRLQAGLAGLGIVGALGASFAIGSATHTGARSTASDPGTASSGSRHHATTSSRSSDDSGDDSGDGSDDSRSSNGTTQQRARASNPQVTQPTPAPPQATTSGS
ncbi:MAG TPA: hypothetical protein VFQ01_02895 [Nocardioides sp.]|jgi:cytoskeletal protein RodZ|nr:hypothetical protein [Nocardioides sp.]